LVHVIGQHVAISLEQFQVVIKIKSTDSQWCSSCNWFVCLADIWSVSCSVASNHVSKGTV